MEEAYLRGNLNIKNFYQNMYQATLCEWIGPPKGDIEPVQAVKADVEQIKNNLKTRTAAAIERGTDFRANLDKLAEEQEMMKERGLSEEIVSDELVQG